MNKKVIYVTSKFPFGMAEIWAIRELTSLVESGVDVTIVPRSDSGEILHEKAKQLSAKTIVTGFINFSIFSNLLKKIILEPKDFLKILKWIYNQSDSVKSLIKGIVVLPKSLYVSRLLRGKGVEHVHAYSSTSVAIVAFIIASELRIPWSITYHASCFVNKKNRRSINSQLKSVDFIRAISNEVANSLKDFINPQFSNKIKVVHMGVECDKLVTINKNFNDLFNIVSPGGPWHFKGIDVSILAASLLLKKGISNFKWTIYGDGPLLKQLTKMSIDLGLEEKFIFAGFINNQNLLDLYKNNEVDLVVLNSASRFGFQEGIPVSLMEAMSYAIPVIGTNSGGTKELVDGESGILINQEDPEATALAIIKLMKDKELGKNKNLKGREKVMREFNTQVTSKQISELFFNNYQN